jgi:hypothetical protein
MLTFVVLTNTLISLTLLYIAWRLRKIKQRVARIADFFTAAEKRTHLLLIQAPQTLSEGQQNIYQLRHRHQLLKLQIQQVRQVFSLLVMGQRVWLRYFYRLGIKR